MGAGDGATDDRAAIAAADSGAGPAGQMVLLRRGAYRVSSNLTVTAPVMLQPGAMIKPDSGVTVLLAGGVQAPQRQVFDHSRGGVVAPQRVDFYHPAWWGPVGTSDDTGAWMAMATALNASKVTDATTAIDFGQRVLAPAGENRFFGITLANCDLIAAKGVSLFYPSGSPTSGSMLTMGDYCTVTGGYWRTDGAGQAVKLIDYQGYRSRVEGVYLVPRATGAIGLHVGSGGSITPVLRDIQIHGVDRLGTGIYLNSPDAELANIWIGPCDKGIDFQRGACSISTLHVWGCNTGLTGSPDSVKISGLYLDSNLGWGLDFVASDRCVITNFHCWNNGAGMAGTGGMRLLQSGAPSSRDNVISAGVFDDNTGIGLLIDGATGTEVDAIRFGSSQVEQGGSAITDTGVRVTSAARDTRLKIRGRKDDHLTAVLDDQSTSTTVELSP
jgi:hypothetical protein